jgi:hypothetical protein
MLHTLHFPTIHLNDPMAVIPLVRGFNTAIQTRKKMVRPGIRTRHFHHYL